MKIFSKYNYIPTRKNILHIPQQFVYDLKMCSQRVKRGWCEKDTWDISQWFLDVIPEMLTYYKQNLHGVPICIADSWEDCDSYAEDYWKSIIQDMIDKFRDANEDTCTRTNCYEKEYLQALDEFTKEYGVLGEKLRTEKEKDSKYRVVHFMREVPKYKEIDEKHFKEELKLAEYRYKRKEEALELFCEYFDELWD